MNIFGFLISLIFIVDGLNLWGGKEVVYYLILFLPFLLYLYGYIKKKKLFSPKKLIYLWAGFSLFSLISVIFSLDLHVSFEQFLLYQSLFLITVYFWNDKENLSKLIEFVINYLSLFFILAFIFKDQILKLNIISSNDNVNLFFPVIGGHNHLGDFLGLAIISSFIKKKYYLIIFFAVFFIISFSRSSYLALFIAFSALIFLKKIPINFKQGSILISLILIVFFAFTFSTREFRPNNFPFKKILMNFNLGQKIFTGHRDKFFLSALLGFKDKPFFGYGMGNYIQISKKYASLFGGIKSDISHNLFLDILSGNGIFAFIFFMAFICLILKKGEKNLNFYLIIYLLINFSFDYTYTSNSLLLLFFLLLASIYKDNSILNVKKLYSLGLIIIFLPAIFMIISQIFFNKKNYRSSISFYPLKKEAYRELINSEVNNNKKLTEQYLKMYQQRFPSNLDQLYISAQTYEIMKDYKSSLVYYKKLYDEGYGFNRKNVLKIYVLYKNLKNSKMAYSAVKDFITKVKKEKKYFLMTYQARLLCLEIYGYPGKDNICKF